MDVGLGDFMNINIELYKIFYYVAKNKNITKAANELLISQPGISKAIKNLEEQLECSLFIRSKSGVVLTDEGKVFYEQIRQAMEIINSAEEKIKEMTNLEYGYLNIGTSNTLTKSFLLPFIENFHKRYPKIKITIFTNQTAELIRKLRNGIIDFIIFNMPYNVPNDFECYKLKDVHDCFIANNNFEELKNKIIPLKELNSYPLILIAKGSNTRDSLDNFTTSLGFNFYPEMELSSYSLVTEFAKIGLGIGIATMEYFDKDIEENSLFCIKTEPELPTRQIGVMYLKSKSLSKCSTQFLEMLK